jgi:hypothetical protein
MKFTDASIDSRTKIEQKENITSKERLNDRHYSRRCSIHFHRHVRRQLFPHHDGDVSFIPRLHMLFPYLMGATSGLYGPQCRKCR